MPKQLFASDANSWTVTDDWDIGSQQAANGITSLFENFSSTNLGMGTSDLSSSGGSQVTAGATAIPGGVVARDFNGDGLADILWQNDNGTPAVWLMNGARIASTGPALTNPGAAWQEKGAADFNGDGKADILWQNDNGTPAVWLMDGTSVITMGPALTNPGSAWHAKHAIDANGNSFGDILWQNDSGTPAVWMMNGVNVAPGGQGGPLLNPGADWHIV